MSSATSSRDDFKGEVARASRLLQPDLSMAANR